MSEILQFHCPACGITLRIPMSAAGMEGPCPRCGQPIGAPDPRYHLPPRRLAPPAGSIQAMMERISRTRAETGPSVPEHYSHPGYANYAPLPFNAPAEPPRHVPAPEYYPSPAQLHPVPPPQPPEPVAVKYPPFDPPPVRPVEPPQAVIYYPWHELGTPSAPEPELIPARPPSVPSFASLAPHEVSAPAPAIPVLVRPEPPPTVVLAPQPAISAPAPEIPKALPVSIPAAVQRPIEPPTTRLREAAPVRRAAEREAEPFSKPLVHSQAILPQPLPREIPSPENPDGRRTILLLSCWVTGIVALVAGLSAGFYLGNRYPLLNSRQGSPTAGGSEASKSPVPEERELRLLPHIPEGSIPPGPEKKNPAPAPTGSSEPRPHEPATGRETNPSALVPVELENTVRSFLTAPNRSTRIRYILFPERTRPKLESWHATHADGAFPDKDLAYDSELQDSKGGPACQIFSVYSDHADSVIPLLAMKTATGWGVDWESFIEFSEDQFARFADGPAGTSGRFHVTISRVEYHADRFPGIDKLTAYRIDPPLPGRTKYAFAATGSSVQTQIEGLIDPTRPNTVVLDLAMQQASNAVPYLEITGLAAKDWIPR